MTKALLQTAMSKEKINNTKNATRMFDYTALADRLRTVNWSNSSHQTGVVNRFTAQASQFPQSSVIKRTHINILVNKPRYIDNTPKPKDTRSGEVITINTKTA